MKGKKYGLSSNILNMNFMKKAFKNNQTNIISSGDNDWFIDTHFENNETHIDDLGIISRPKSLIEKIHNNSIIRNIKKINKENKNDQINNKIDTSNKSNNNHSNKYHRYNNK